MNPAVAIRTRQILTALLAVVILVPSLWGFGSKFVEFVILCRSGSDGAFALMPVLNYLLASIGFLLLFCWATLQGMFRDIERPKYTMLENEQRLNKAAAVTQRSWSEEGAHGSA